MAFSYAATAAVERFSEARRATACRAGFRRRATRRPLRAARGAWRCRGRCRCSCSRACRLSLRWSTLPLAPGACGQPPMPARVASKRATPTSSAAYTFAIARPRVSWKWPHQKRSPATCTPASNRSRTMRGSAYPTVSAMLTRSAPASSSACMRRSTSDGSTRPCSVQPNAVPTPPSIRVLRSCSIARGANLRHFGDHFVGRLAQVGEAVGVTGGQRHEQEVGAGLDRALRALEVRHQDRDEETRQRFRVGDELGGVRKLRQKVRRHERAHFDLALARGVRVADPFALALGRQDGLDALQAVAQADFADHDAAGKGLGHRSSSNGAGLHCRLSIAATLAVPKRLDSSI